MTEETSYIAKAPIRRLMKNCGADLVAEDALAGLVAYLEQQADALTKKALKVAEADKRKKITAQDVIKAAKA